MTFRFTIPGEPAGKGRPRATTINGNARMYTPAKTARYENLVSLAFMQAGGKKYEGALQVEINATFSMPLSWSMKRRKDMDGAACSHKIDADNIAKIVCDALNKIAYNDDRQIAELLVRKRWGHDGGVVVAIAACDVNKLDIVSEAKRMGVKPHNPIVGFIGG